MTRLGKRSAWAIGGCAVALIGLLGFGGGMTAQQQQRAAGDWPNITGSNAGTRPKELLLLALGGCTASDVISILKKKRVELEGFEIHLTAKQRDEHPQVFTEIHLDFVIRGNEIRPEDVVRAIELSESKYCSVSAMLRPAVPITWTYRIEPGRAVRPAA